MTRLAEQGKTPLPFNPYGLGIMFSLIPRKAYHIFDCYRTLKILRCAHVTRQSEYKDPCVVLLLHHICAPFAARRMRSFNMEITGLHAPQALQKRYVDNHFCNYSTRGSRQGVYICRSALLWEFPARQSCHIASFGSIAGLQ
jgi:hypothetical protein